MPKSSYKAPTEIFVVVLLEPTNGASEIPLREMLEASDTLKWVDATLRYVSGGMRT